MQARDVPRKKLTGDPATFGGRFKLAYKAAGISGKDLALLAGLSQPQVSKLVIGETGLETPNFIRLVAAALEAGVCAEYLFLGREPKARPGDPRLLERLSTMKAQEAKQATDDLAAAKRSAKAAVAKKRVRMG